MISLTGHGLLILGDSGGHHVLDSEIEGARELEIEVGMVRQELPEVNARRIDHNRRDLARYVVCAQLRRHAGDLFVHNANDCVVDDIADLLATLSLGSRKTRVNIHERQGRHREVKHVRLLGHGGHGLRNRDRGHGWHGGHRVLLVLLVLSSVVVPLLVVLAIAALVSAPVAVSATLAVLILAALALAVVLLVVLMVAALAPILLLAIGVGLLLVVVVLVVVVLVVVI